MATVTVPVGEHRVTLSPDGTVQVDVVVLLPTDWKRLVSVVRTHYEDLGLSPRQVRRQPSSLLRPAPLWIRLVTFGRIRDLPGGPSLPKGVVQYR